MSRKFVPRFTRAMMMLFPLAKAFTLRGGDIETVLARNGIPSDALVDPAMLVKASACYSVMEDMAELLGDSYFSAEVAIETARNGTPGLRDAASQAVNLGDFLCRLVVEISKQVDNVRYSVSVTPDVASLEIQRTIRMPKRTKQVDAVGVAFYVTVIKQGIGGVFDPRRLLVTVPTTEGLPPGFLPRQALIESKINGLRIAFPSLWLWAPFSLDWDLTEVSRGELAADRPDEPFRSYLRGVLMDNIDDQKLSLNRFAAICGMHPRNIQRILWGQGTSYSQMKDDMRQSITKDLLSNTTIQVAEIAHRVGLSGSAALDRAFRRWTGNTPTRSRAESRPDQIARVADEQGRSSTDS